ncbi:hypothetical protein M2277_005104 [Paenibacillus sp. LBL]|uniref:hypothetical protein n=1 Tax=Paenibacillus sp. LBL TaxID=2940563 RepID=UPI002472F279|nr:hypothetical protein [Paenibacillus sp. LBL]MDH6674412.1 hypothetical protein [Paenibacillus sp. LBL]
MANKKTDFGVITEGNVDAYIQSLIESSKSSYINQTVAFNKKDPHQLSLLRAALLEHSSFGGLIKQILWARYEEGDTQPLSRSTNVSNTSYAIPSVKPTLQQPVDGSENKEVKPKPSAMRSVSNHSSMVK